jgi:glycosyltransferase involved in cell wall biosynthesis
MSVNNIAILLPALDEAETIGRVIGKIPKKELADLGYTVDIVVVDGHSQAEGYWKRQRNPNRF